MTRFKWLVLIILAGLLSACSFIEETTLRGSGDIEMIEEDYADFDEVEISHAFKVDIVQGERFDVIIRIDDNVAEYLDVRKQGDKLRIGLDRNRLNILSDVTLEAEITMPALTRISLSGASQVDLEGFSSSDDLNCDLSGASKLRGEINTGDLTLDVSGASTVELSGSADELNAEASGASKLELEDFEVGNADVELSGASRATVNASGRLDVNASGASRLLYVGNPESINQDTSGASSVSQK